MSEHLPQSNEDLSRLLAIQRLVHDKFPDDEHFMLEELADEQDVNGFLYGQLLEIGEDPDEVMEQYEILEKEQ